VTIRRILAIVALTVAAASTGWLLFVGLPRWYGAPAHSTAPPSTAAPASEDGRKIKARLFYVADDGTRLTSVDRDVPYADQPADQARRILEAQLAPVTTPLVSAIPAGTTLRALFVGQDGTAYVDLSREVMTAHPGGSDAELLTVYSLVEALTTNLPAITSVQLLVDGKAVDTLAGHIDTRRPIRRADAWVAQ
jgi:spore germination protein GerM